MLRCCRCLAVSNTRRIMDKNKTVVIFSIILSVDIFVLLSLSIMSGKEEDVFTYFSVISIPVVILAVGLGVTIFRNHPERFRKGYLVWFATFSILYLLVNSVLMPNAGPDGASWVVAYMFFFGSILNSVVVLVLLVVGELLIRRSKPR